LRACLGVLLLAATLRADGGASLSDTFNAGKTEYANGNHDKAIELLREVIKKDPKNAEAYLWLGRALGRKAENSNFLHAAFMVGDIKKALEKAVELAPQDDDCRGDLLDFYLDAPASMGGGLDRAREQARIMAQQKPGEGHWAASRIAEKQKDYPTAEKELLLADKVDPKPGRWRQLAHFYRSRGRWTDMEAAFKKADDVKSHYYLAEGYFQWGQKLEDAEKLARRFLAESNPAPGDEPTRAQARLLLGQIQARLGKREEATKELRTALAENPSLKAARRELERLK
jgi:tetratricopeptide (TPR) repeat protein